MEREEATEEIYVILNHLRSTEFGGDAEATKIFGELVLRLWYCKEIGVFEK
jgi:hypothetical protein